MTLKLARETPKDTDFENVTKKKIITSENLR